MKPEGQMHLKPSERSKHVPLFLQGDDWHSSVWISHKLPEKPRGETRQSKERMRGVVEIPMPTNYKLKFPTHKELGVKVQTNLKSFLSLRAIRLAVWNERRWIDILLGRRFLKYTRSVSWLIPTNEPISFPICVNTKESSGNYSWNGDLMWLDETALLF